MFTFLATLFGCGASAQDYKNLSVDDFETLIAKDGIQLLDCRTAEEYAEGHIAGAILADVKLDSFEETATAILAKNAPVAVYCRSGRRSLTACEILSKAGYKELYNLETGILGWIEAGKPITKSTMKEATIETLKAENTIDLIAKQWMLVTAGTKDSFNTMTANWGGIGYLWNKNVAFVFVRPERYTHDFIEREDRFTLSFYPEECRKALQICGTKSGRDIDKVKETGLSPEELPSGAVTFSQARLTLDCKKLFKTEMSEADFIDKETMNKCYGEHGGFHTVYVVEIEKVYAK